ncbi:MAG: hypothetical protein LBO09_02020 [Candidatus Peribacteria bacterium]|nr:hypothetical protein [Candidatus Peribacteria bacterium]
MKFDSRGAVQVGAVGNSSSCTVGQIGTISSGSTTCLCACTSNGAWKSMVDDENGTCEMVCNKDSLRSASCTGKPDNSSYNTATSVIQTLHGGVWTPSTVATYNITPSTTECRYTCNPGYVRNGSLCAPTRNITINSEVWLATPMPGGINVDIEVHEIYHMFRYDSLSSQQTYTRSYALNGLFPDVLSIQMTYTLTNVNMQGDGVYKVELINPATQAVIQTVADAWSPPTQNDISSLAYNLPITTATSYSIPTLKISPSTTQVYTLTVNPGGITFP